MSLSDSLTEPLFDFGTYDKPLNDRELPRRLVTFETFVQGDEKTRHDQKNHKVKDKYKDKDKDNYNDKDKDKRGVL